ncbi:unnamed protein product [Chondrus crispus]|uniref:Uncharacterized protein n=1 Tax=Chondrus crispus TaxID=2769 RepID=R7QB36_CHOCR|nr:unnamed protein product [Chondrus crispus]CDF35727.1 unnamed protein product [Chondrus crispus]|eukprot:XP_005715546.1 unnamed protein product [Chondrus crispus]
MTRRHERWRETCLQMPAMDLLHSTLVLALAPLKSVSYRGIKHGDYTSVSIPHGAEPPVFHQFSFSEASARSLAKATNPRLSQSARCLISKAHLVLVGPTAHMESRRGTMSSTESSCAKPSQDEPLITTPLQCDGV